MHQRKHVIGLLLFFLLVLAASCRKDAFITGSGATISTSADTLHFDTVFTSVGSVTQVFKVNNTNDQKLLFSSIRLMGGSASAYTININGVAAPERTNVELAANDSLYIFVTVKIDPTLDRLPFIVRDSVQINYNGNTRYVQLEAFGQNAHFLRDQVITGTRLFTSDLPYVILGKLRVDTTATLTLQPGTRMYFRNNAPLLVDGTLLVQGTLDEPVTFAGDRLDEDYRDLPASWPGIYYRNTSKNNVMRFAQVKNAYQAVVLEGPSSNANPKLRIQQSRIDNAYDAGIYAIASSILADNCLVSNCGANLNLQLGGEYAFTNCSFPAYSVYLPRTKPVLWVTNYASIGGNELTNDLSASFTNCIFWADNSIVKDEVQTARKGTTGIFQVDFVNCIYKAEADPAGATFTHCLKNADPLFDSVSVRTRYFDFHTTRTEAPGRNTGIPTLFPQDLDGQPRNTGGTDIGCFEKQP